MGPLNPAKGSGERCKLTQLGLGPSPSRQTIWCIYWSQKVQLWSLVAAVFRGFPENKCANSCLKVQ